MDRLLRRRRKSDQRVPEDDSVVIADEHAWWAAREELDSTSIPTGRTKKPVEDAPKHSAFEGYFTAESLFEPSEVPEVLDDSDPYIVLGLPPSASWEQISAAHRRLAKLHHPDRLVSATTDERAAGDERIRDLNIAYMELRRRRGR